MKTEAQIKAAIYTAITTDTAIVANMGTRLIWMLKPEITNIFPMATMQILDTVGAYVIGGSVILSNENVDVQITLYADYSDYVKFDTLTNDIKRVMASIGYTLTASPEFVEESINKTAKAMRWRYINV